MGAMTQPGSRSFETKPAAEVRFTSGGGLVVRDFDLVKSDIAKRVTGTVAGGPVAMVWIDGKPLRVGDKVVCKFSSAPSSGTGTVGMTTNQPLTTLVRSVEEQAAVEKLQNAKTKESVLGYTIESIDPGLLVLKSDSNETVEVDIDVQSSSADRRTNARGQRIDPDEIVVATGIVIHPAGYLLTSVSKPSSEPLFAYTGHGKTRLILVSWDSITGVGLFQVSDRNLTGSVSLSTLGSPSEVLIQGCTSVGAVPVAFKGGLPGHEPFTLPREILAGAAILDADGRLAGITVGETGSYRMISVAQLSKLTAMLPSPAAETQQAWHEYSVLITRSR